jgi:hypothetical protein
MARQVRVVRHGRNLKGENAMNPLVKARPEDTALATDAFLQSTVVPIDNEPTPRLIVESPLPGPLAQGIVLIPYRVENVRILPVAGPAARKLSPRVGHSTGTLGQCRGDCAAGWEANR